MVEPLLLAVEDGPRAEERCPAFLH
jgi:hypothetical protein